MSKSKFSFEFVFLHKTVSIIQNLEKKFFIFFKKYRNKFEKYAKNFFSKFCIDQRRFMRKTLIQKRISILTLILQNKKTSYRDQEPNPRLENSLKILP